MCRWILLAGLFLFFLSNSFASEAKVTGDDCSLGRSAPEADWYYCESSAFVGLPATLGYYSFYPGGYLFAYPILLPLNKCDLSDTNVESKNIAHYSLGRFGYMVVGSPFYVLETLFWDAPIYVYEIMSEENVKPQDP